MTGTTLPDSDTTVDHNDLTEATNATIAKRVAEQYRNRLAYVRSTDKEKATDRAAGWLHYQGGAKGEKGGVWTRKGAEVAALNAVEDTIRAMLVEVNQTERDGSKLRERNRELLNALNRIPAIKHVASYRLDRAQSDFNPDRDLLNVKNGVLDLRALDPADKRQGEGHKRLLRDARAEDWSTMQVQAEYHLDAKPPTRWLRFLDEVFEGDQQVIAYVQRALGYTLLGRNPQHAAFVCYGSGGNGKSTLVETVADLLGGYAGALTPDVLVGDYVRTGTSLQPEMTVYRDTRLIYTSEPKKGVLNSARIKSWTGDEHIQLRMMYGEPLLMPVTFTLWLMTNALPDLNEVNKAVERRMHVIPFMAEFNEHPDITLKEQFRREYEGILMWLVEGLRQWYAQGSTLDPPAAVKQAAKDWYDSESLYTRIFKEILVRGTSRDRIKLADLREALTDFVYGHEEDFPRVTVNQKLVEGFLKSHGLMKRTVGGVTWVYGVRLATEDDDSDQEDGEPAADADPYTTRERAYLAIAATGSLVGMCVAEVAAETGLPQRSLYVTLQRLANQDVLVKEDSVYKVHGPGAIAQRPDGDALVELVADLIEKHLRRKAEEQSATATAKVVWEVNEQRVHHELRDLWLSYDDVEHALDAIVRRGHELGGEGTDWAGRPCKGYYWHFPADHAAA